MSPDVPEDGDPVLHHDSMQWNNSGWTEKPWSAPHLAPLFTELTSAKSAPSWARRAVKIIHRYTREHGEPPTFRELFTELAAQDPDYADHEEAWSSRAVRSLVMVHWRRQGWVRYRTETRTLRSGPTANGDLFPATRSPRTKGARREAPQER